MITKEYHDMNVKRYVIVTTLKRQISDIQIIKIALWEILISLMKVHLSFELFGLVFGV